MKIILCNTPQGQYGLPLELIAKDRANYYAIEIEELDADSDEWKKEFDWIMKDDYEGIDWLLNNYEWEDWENEAFKINNTVKVTEDDFWTSSDDFEIINYKPL